MSISKEDYIRKYGPWIKEVEEVIKAAQGKKSNGEVVEELVAKVLPGTDFDTIQKLSVAFGVVTQKYEAYGWNRGFDAALGALQAELKNFGVNMNVRHVDLDKLGEMTDDILAKVGVKKGDIH